MTVDLNPVTLEWILSKQADHLSLNNASDYSGSVATKKDDLIAMKIDLTFYVKTKILTEMCDVRLWKNEIVDRSRRLMIKVLIVL